MRAERESASPVSPSKLGQAFAPVLLLGDKGSLLLERITEHASDIFAVLPENTSGYKMFEPPEPLSKNDWNLLLASAATRTYRKDEIILEEGQENRYTCVAANVTLVLMVLTGSCTDLLRALLELSKDRKLWFNLWHPELFWERCQC